MPGRFLSGYSGTGYGSGDRDRVACPFGRESCSRCERQGVRRPFGQIQRIQKWTAAVLSEGRMDQEACTGAGEGRTGWAV